MPGLGAALPWWDVPGVLERVVADLLHAELRRLRPGGALPPPAWQWRFGTRLDENGAVGADSLELLSLSAAAAELMGQPGAALLEQPTLGGWCAVLRTAAREQPPASVPFRTSGSTGAPRRHCHPLAALEAEAACLARLLVDGAGNRRRVWSAVPFHHAYGFIHGVLLPRHLAAAGTALPVLDARPHAPGAIPGLLQSGDLVLGHPVWWDAVVGAAAQPLPGGVLCVTSTAPCPPDLARAVLGLGAARLLQVYGSSETAGVGWRDGPDDPFTLLPCRDGEALRRGAPEALLDNLEWQDAERFRIAGRRDGAVQVGGHNVYPARVREVLLRHPAVLDAAVRPMPAAAGGRLKAFVVPRPGASEPGLLRRHLAEHADAALAPPERPRSYSFGDALPRNEMGKLAEWPVEHAAA